MKKLFSKYFYSTSNPEEAGYILNYLKNSSNDSKITDLMEPHWDRNLNETLENPRSNPSLLKRVIREINYADNVILSRKLKVYKVALRIAAVLIIGIVVGSVILVSNYSNNKLTENLQFVQTPLGVKTKIKLDDGSTVWMNSGSQISYPVKFRRTRKIELSGEAYFDVAKSKKPFIVSAKFGDIAVYGTSFNVKAYPDEESFEVTLEEGRVGIESLNGNQSIHLKPGQQAYLENNSLKVKSIDTEYYTSWKDGKMIFKREPFRSFVTKLERWYNIDIEYSDPELDEIWYSGTIEMETISEVMDLISKSAPITYNYDRKNRVFTLKTK